MVSTAHNPKAELWRSAIIRVAKDALFDRSLPIFTGVPIKLACVFVFRPPASALDRIGQPHTIVPDASNLLKLVEDALEAVRLFDNDCRIFKPAPEKWWGERAGVHITLEAQGGDDRCQVGPVCARPDWL